MLNIHMDTDFGGDPDDFAALLMLLGLPDVQISGITTVLDAEGYRAGAVKHILGIAGREGIPVATGAKIGLTSPTVAEHRQDFWPEILPSPADHPGESLELIENSLNRRSVLALIGPQTNVAMLNRVVGTSLRGFRVVHMGGFIEPAAVGYPQWTAADDFNIQFDTRAAEVLYQSSADITMVPTAIAMQAWVKSSDVERIDKSGPLGALLANQIRIWGQEQDWPGIGTSHDALPNDLAGILWDPITILIAAGWQGATTSQMSLMPVLEDGIMRFVGDEEAGRPVDVVTSIDTESFREAFITAIESAQAGILP